MDDAELIGYTSTNEQGFTWGDSRPSWDLEHWRIDGLDIWYSPNGMAWTMGSPDHPKVVRWNRRMCEKHGHRAEVIRQLRKTFERELRYEE